MRQGPSSNEPSNGCCGWPRRSTSHPSWPSMRDGGGLLGRVPHPHVELGAVAGDGRDLGPLDGQGLPLVGRVGRGLGHAGDRGGVGHQQRQEGVVDQGVGVGLAGLHAVAHAQRPGHLRALHGDHGPGRQRSVGHGALRQHAGGPQQGEGQPVGPLVARRARHVDQLVLEQALVHHGETAGLHETPRRERGHGRARWARPRPRGRGSPRRRRTRRSTTRGRLGQREPGPQAVVAAGVVERGGHPHQALAGLELEGGRHLDVAFAGAGTAHHPLGPAVGGRDLQPGPQRARPRGRSPTPTRAGRRPGRRRAGSSCRCRRRRRRRPDDRSRPRPSMANVASSPSTSTLTSPLARPAGVGRDRCRRSAPPPPTAESTRFQPRPGTSATRTSTRRRGGAGEDEPAGRARVLGGRAASSSRAPGRSTCRGCWPGRGPGAPR